MAYALHEAGVPVADAAALLGHTVQAHLTTYVWSTSHSVAGAAERLGQALSAAEG